MTIAMTVLAWVASALLAAGAVLCLVRIVRGPTLLDRLIAADVLLTSVILILGAEMIINAHSRNVTLMIVIAAVATFATIAVARTVAKHDRGRG